MCFTRRYLRNLQGIRTKRVLYVKTSLNSLNSESGSWLKDNVFVERILQHKLKSFVLKLARSRAGTGFCEVYLQTPVKQMQIALKENQVITSELESTSIIRDPIIIGVMN